jgi:hypothetical protein
MLFDLRGRGRRRTVQVIYLSLAILMGGGLVLFGIGGATSGGLFDAFSSDSGTQNVSSTYEKQVESNQAKVKVNPKDVAAWAALTRAQVQQAGVAGYDDATGTYTADGLKQLQTAATSWETYLDLDPKKPDGNLASLMVNTYGPTALNDPVRAAQALALVIDERGGSSALYTQLAVLYYTAGNVRKSVLAEQDAVRLADPDQRKLVKARIAAQRKQIDKAKLQGAVQQSGGAAAQGSGG